jgi:hypothetical protein
VVLDPCLLTADQTQPIMTKEKRQSLKWMKDWAKQNKKKQLTVSRLCDIDEQRVILA